MRFINRQTTNPNRKTLFVRSVNYNTNTGEISTMVVDETNNEGTVTVEGTKLNASNLNNAFEDLNRGKFLHFYFKEVFGITIDEDNFTIEFSGSNTKTINILYEYELYPVLWLNQYLNVSLTNNNQTLNISMKPEYQTSSRTGKVYVDIYSDQFNSDLVTTLNIAYTYTPASSNPED